MSPVAYAKIAAVAALSAVLFFGGRSCGKQAGDAEVNALKRHHAEETAKVATMAVATAAKARKATQLWGDAYIDIARRHLEEQRDAERKHDVVVAGLLSGAERLRDHWEGCVSTGPSDATGGPVVDGRTEDRAESAGRIVQYAAECDAQVKGLQSTLLETAKRLRESQ